LKAILPVGAGVVVAPNSCALSETEPVPKTIVVAVSVVAVVVGDPVTVNGSEIHALFELKLFASPLVYVAWNQNEPAPVGVNADGEVYNPLAVTTSLPSTPPVAGVVHELSVNTLNAILPVGAGVVVAPVSVALSETEPLPKTIEVAGVSTVTVEV
jgi:hypothetical protein